MSKAEHKLMVSMRLDPALVDAMKRVQRQDGASMTWQVETALAAWLKRKGELKPTSTAAKRKR